MNRPLENCFSQEAKLSPMMEQWQACKKKARDALLLFRLGDFYEAFYEDAWILSKETNITITKRQNVPMSGVPAQHVDEYIEVLLKKNYLIAIAEQIETENTSTATSKSLMKRDVVQIISPATHKSSQSKDNHNFFASLFLLNNIFGFCAVDIFTGEICIYEIENIEDCFNELYKQEPSEILLSDKLYQPYQQKFIDMHHAFTFRLQIQGNPLHIELSQRFLLQHFRVHALDGLGLQKPSVIQALGNLLYHLQHNLYQNVSHINRITIQNNDKNMELSPYAMHHLNLMNSSTQSTASLFHVLNHTKTPMGFRLLKKWILHPLLSIQEINQRLDSVEKLIHADSLLEKSLSSIRDLEKLATKLKKLTATPLDLWMLAHSLSFLPHIYDNIKVFHTQIFSQIVSDFYDFDPFVKIIYNKLLPSPPITFKEGGIFQHGAFQDIDDLRKIKEASESWLIKHQQHLRESLQMKNLKIAYTKAFGYFIEVSRAQAAKMPSSFEKKQTLLQGERFISPELQKKAYEILHADERCIELEKLHFLQFRQELSSYADKIQKTAAHIAIIDVLQSFACTAKERNYSKPFVHEELSICLKNSRHPILESLTSQSSCIPNDVNINGKDGTFLLITGPNMAGKSTFALQVASIALLAQIGSFVPADHASIGIVDKIFTRIGARDNLPKGQSTFMTEMIELSYILRYVTPKSLVILDEIGRGTGTNDGLSIACASSEMFIKKNTRTIFSTHFQELSHLLHYPNVKPHRLAIQEEDDAVIFLYKIEPGIAHHSYGIHVAQLAGLPTEVLRRAKNILSKLEQKETKQEFSLYENVDLTSKKNQENSVDFLLQQLRNSDLKINDFIKAMQILQQLQKCL